jgi:signal transduction histidine kinase
VSDHRRSWIKSLGRVWPQSLFGRLVAASAIAVLLAQGVALLLIAHERERFVLEESVRDWSRRIAEVTLVLQPMDSGERAETITRLIDQNGRFGRRALARELRRQLPPLQARAGTGPPAGSDPPPPGATDDSSGAGARAAGRAPGSAEGARVTDGAPLVDGAPGPAGGPGNVDAPSPPQDGGGPRPPHVSLPPPTPRPRVTILPLPLAGDFAHPLEETLQSILGVGYRISVTPTPAAAKPAIPVSPLLGLERRDPGGLYDMRTSDADRLYDVTVHFPDGDSALFRLARPAEGAPLPRNLFVNLSLLVIIMTVALFVTARTITLPLRQLARAADRVGRDVRQPQLEVKGAREIRNAARAFNTMQDRLQRYLDSRTRVLAAMSHDLKTPLTRLRLQVETLDNPDAQDRIGKQLDEMESMVRGALALFRGLNDDEALAPVDINALVATLQSEFLQMGKSVTISGAAQREITGKPQGLKRCLTNLIENAVKFGGLARVHVEDGAAVVIRIEDDGPGVPVEELERVFEPFYRVESSRNRDSGGTGLGLSIARDIAQAHGGSLVLQNLPERGLEAILTLPRQV